MSPQTEIAGQTYLGAGTVLAARYEIAREIGRGGYSVVYLARDRELETDVALKLLVPPPALARLARERMRREAMAARGLAHPNIVALHDFLEDGPWTFIVMEYVEGSDLGDRVGRNGPLPVEEAVRLGVEVATALDAAHRQGVLHRDVKPQNVLLDGDSRARLADFGSARLEGQATVTATGGLVGTLAYAAPEEMLGRRADARSDVYSLGLTLYWALTGTLPDRPSTHLPPSPREGGYRPRAERGEVPVWLDDIVACATSASTGHRFPTAGALADALRVQTAAERGGTDAEAGARLPYASVGEWCPLCGTVDEIGLGVCPSCAGGAGRADTLLFIRTPSVATERRELQGKLAQPLAGSLRGGDLRDVLNGLRPLVRLPAESAPGAVARLAERGIPVAAVPMRRAWTQLPASFAAVLMAVFVAGLLAALVAHPPMLWLTPTFAVLLLLLGVRRLQSPVPGGRGGSRLTLPAKANAAVRDTLSHLGPGPARDLLTDVVSMGAGLYSRSDTSGGPDVAEPLAELLGSACEVAVDLGDLDESLTILDGKVPAQAAADGSAEDADWIALQTRATRARDGLARQLLETLAVLGRARISAASGEPVGERLRRVADELETDLATHAEARLEVEALLG